MRKFYSIFLVIVIPLFSVSREEKYIYTFKSANDIDHTKMLVIGETISIEKASVLETKLEQNMMDIDSRPDTVTVKILYNPGLRVGQTLYLIEKSPDHDSFKDGNIVGQINVVSVFNTSFYGQRLRGEGYLRLIEDKTMTVAMPIGSEKLNEAKIVKKQGDYFFVRGDYSNAIFSYRKAIKLDSFYPDPHYALAKLHLKDGEGYVSAGFEFLQAYKNRDKFSEENEKFEFLLDYINYINYRHKTELVASKSRIEEASANELKKAILIYQEAKAIHGNSYPLEYAITETYFLLYDFAKDLPGSVSTRNMQEEYFELASQSIDSLLIKPKNDYKLYRLATLIYNDRLNKLQQGRNIPVSKRETIEHLTAKRKKYLNKYLTLKPAREKTDPAILMITESAE